jgi:hypothetical protein
MFLRDAHRCGSEVPGLGPATRTRSGQKSAREPRLPVLRIPHLDPRKRKSGPGNLSERSRRATAPRTGLNDPKTERAVDGIGLQGLN